MKVVLAALGEGGLDGVTLGAYNAIKHNYTVFRTERHEATRALLAMGVEAVALDSLYEQAGDFDSLCALIAGRVVEEARKRACVVYAVPGGAGFADATVAAVTKACSEAGIALAYLPGPGYFESAALIAGGLESAVVCPASRLERSHINTKLPLVLAEVDSALLAGDCKLALLEHYPDNHEILSINGHKSEFLPLCEMDMRAPFSHTRSFIIPPLDILSLSRYDFSRLLDLIAILRGRGDGDFEGCPWDMEQTHVSLKTSLVEEAYEVIDAVDSGDPDRLADELGDLLLQIVLHAQIAREHGEFDSMDVTTAICRKMIYRHPHIFASAKAKTSEDVLLMWEDIKRKEKKLHSVTASMRDIPKALPALMRGAKVQKKAAHVGFDWPDVESALGKIAEEADEVRAELKSGDSVKLFEELGDLLFAALNIPRMLGVDAEQALGCATDKFIDRFALVESMAADAGKEVSQLPFETLDAMWNRAKELIKQE